jgi:magnesium transporter
MDRAGGVSAGRRRAGGNAGIQTLAVIICDLALGLLNGLAMGLIVGIRGHSCKQDAHLGFVVGAAMLLNTLAAALSGVLIPYRLKWLRIDPELASSILLTTVTDIAGFFFFLGLAALVMRWWG